jgi:tRNA pseudouridine38-40 synthase
LQRIKITIAYNGKAYFGSQEQKHKKTVVGDFHFGLQKLNIKEKAIFSGRTDKGVHSTGQVLHIDIPTHWTIENFSYAIKRVLPKAIIVRK